MRRTLKISLSGLLAALAAYPVLLAEPYPLYAYQTSYSNIRVWSDRPISPAIQPLLQQAEARLKTSPIYDPALEQRIFICNDLTRFAFFASYQYKVGGINYAFLNRNIFLRPVNIDHNRLISPVGHEVPGERTLVYFLAHEMTHSLEARYLGRLGFALLPQWKSDGYADVVGRGGEFDFNAQLKAFHNGDSTLDYARSGLYLRFQLMCEHLIRNKGLSVQDLLRNKINPAAVEKELNQRFSGSSIHGGVA